MALITPNTMKKQIDGTKLQIRMAMLTNCTEVNNVNVNKISQLADKILHECEIGAGRNAEETK